MPNLGMPELLILSVTLLPFAAVVYLGVLLTRYLKAKTSAAEEQARLARLQSERLP